jgi:hypothetical protein
MSKRIAIRHHATTWKFVELKNSAERGDRGAPQQNGKLSLTWRHGSSRRRG